MLVKQLKLGYMDNFTYIVGCEKTKEAMIVDPAADADLIVDEAKKAGLTIQYILNTHGHGDHTAANGRLKELTGASVVMHKNDAHRYPNGDIRLDREETFQLGKITLQIIHTPGHSPGSISLFAEGQLFTGDTLFVKYCGRIDLPGSDPAAMAKSLKKLMELPDDTVVWPGHDYGPKPNSTIKQERLDNEDFRYMLSEDNR